MFQNLQYLHLVASSNNRPFFWFSRSLGDHFLSLPLTQKYRRMAGLFDEPDLYLIHDVKFRLEMDACYGAVLGERYPGQVRYWACVTTCHF